MERTAGPWADLHCSESSRGADLFTLRLFDAFRPGPEVEAAQPDSEQFRSSPRIFQATLEDDPSAAEIGHVSNLRRRVPTWRGQNKKIDAPLNARFRQT